MPDIASSLLTTDTYRMPPKSVDNGWLTMFRSGMWRLLYKLSSEAQRRYYQELLPLLHDTKAEVMGPRDDDCYYLVYIGTKPSGQRRGYARKLIEHMAARADGEGRAMYLESSSEKNNAYYAKFGFVVVKDVSMGSPSAETGTTPVRMSIMVREPQRKQVVTVTGTKKAIVMRSAGIKRH
jgi:GNAT superfamily N-acetyltransferase